MAQGRLADAEASLVPAMRILEAAPSEDGMELAAGRNYVAELRRLQGDDEGAAAIFEALVRDAETALGASHPHLPYFLNNLAGVYRDQGRFDEAETLLRRSLALRRSAAPPDGYAVARATMNLAELYRDQGKREEAEPLYVEALAAARTALGSGHPELFEFLNQLAVLRRDQQAFAKAEPLLREALALAERGFGPDAPRVAQSHLDIAVLLRARGRCTAARPHLDRARAIREQAFGPAHPDVAEVLAASAACRPADAAGRRAAGEELDRAIGILEGSGAFPAVEVEALETRARLVRPRDRARSGADLDAAIGIVERMRPHRGGGESVRASFFERHKRLYDLAVRWDVEDKRTDRALATAERARARVLLDQLSAAGVGADSNRDPDLSRRLTESRARLAETRQRLVFEQGRDDLPRTERVRRIAELESRLAQDTRDFRALHDEARNTSPAWRGATGAPLVTAAEIQKEIVPAGGWLLLYQIGDARSYLFAVPHDGPTEVFVLQAGPRGAAALGIAPGPVTAATLGRALFGAREKDRGASAEGLLPGLASPPAPEASGRPRSARRGIGGITTGSGPAESGLHALWRVLVPPALWTRIRGASQVLVVPDGPLYLLPFEALVVSAGADPASSRYWIDDGPVIRYAPSASFLLQLRRLERARAAASPARRSPARAERRRSRLRGFGIADPAAGHPRSGRSLGRCGRRRGAEASRGRARAASRARPTRATSCATRCARSPTWSFSGARTRASPPCAPSSPASATSTSPRTRSSTRRGASSSRPSR